VPVGDRLADPAETDQLASILQQTTSAIANVSPGPDAGGTRRAITLELQSELRSFLSNHLDSAWAPSIALFLGRAAQLRSGYSQAIVFYRQSYLMTAASS